MRRSIFVFVLMIFISSSVAQTTQPATGPATNPTKITPDAQAMLDQVREAYTKLSTLELSGTFAMDMDVAGEQRRESATFTASFQAPNKFRHDMKDDVTVVGTGEKLFSVLVSRNQYISVEAPPTRTSALGAGVGDLLHEQNPSLTLALSADAIAELAEETREIDKIDETTLKLVQDDRDVLVLIDPQTNLLRGMQVDLTRLFVRQGVPQVKRAMITIAYDKSIAGGQFEPTKFAFTPPPGATLIKTEMAFLGDQAGPSEPGESPAQKLVGQEAPAFRLPTLDGAVTSLNDAKGNVVVLDFWATWCPPCREGLPHLEEIYKSQREQGVIVFAVNERETREKAQEFMTQQKLTVPVLLDEAGEVGAQYLVTGIPQTVVIGRDGKIANVFVGFGEGSAEKLAQAVEAAKQK